MENVLLVFGGMSYEHDISVVTASQIYSKTQLDNIKLIPFYISRDNKYYIYKSSEFNILDFSISNFSSNKRKFKEVAFVSNENNIIFAKTKFGLREYLKTELAIFACHGSSGENGTLEAIFENVGIFSTAGNFDSLAICMNKYIFKQFMYGIKIPTVSGFKITKTEYENKKDLIESKVIKFNFPLILKPNNGGSSIGLFIARNLEDFNKMILDVFEFDNEVLVEKYISNSREFNVAVLGDYDEYLVSDIDEPLKENEVLTFTDKYCSNFGVKNSKIDKSLKHSMANNFRNFPASISDGLSKRIYKLTKKIFTKLNLRGVVRIDYLYDEINDKIYVCEVNSIPGSLAFYFFNNNKLLLNDFVLKLINIAKKYKTNKFIVNKDYFTEILK